MIHVCPQCKIETHREHSSADCIEWLRVRLDNAMKELRPMRTSARRLREVKAELRVAKQAVQRLEKQNKAFAAFTMEAADAQQRTAINNIVSERLKRFENQMWDRMEAES